MGGQSSGVGHVPFRQCLAGAVGGLLTFLILEPGMRAQELAKIGMGNLDVASALSHGLFLGVAAGSSITALLAFGDQLSFGRLQRLVWRTVLGVIVGGVTGAVAGLIAEILFGFLVAFAMLAGTRGMILVARTVGWALFGAGVGLAGGLLSRSQRRVTQGIIGGLIGGAIGGAMFDTLAAMSGGGVATTSRLFGFTALGACVGLATALVEQLARVAWVTFLSGGREGRQVLLHRTSTLLGRDEMVDIPLFGDQSVSRRQAILDLQPQPMIREIGEKQLLMVDGVPTSQALLSDGSTIQIGQHRFRFFHRHAPGVSPATPLYPTPPAYPSSVPAAYVPVSGPAYAPASYQVAPAAVAPVAIRMPGSALSLRVIEGQDSGRTCTIAAGGMFTIGRETDNSLSLADLKVSRYHCRVESLDDAWMVTDLQSRNGTRLNGLAVQRAGLAAGDRLSVGDTTLEIEPDSGTMERTMYSG